MLAVGPYLQPPDPEAPAGCSKQIQVCSFPLSFPALHSPRQQEHRIWRCVTACHGQPARLAIDAGSSKRARSSARRPGAAVCLDNPSVSPRASPGRARAAHKPIFFSQVLMVSSITSVMATCGAILARGRVPSGSPWTCSDRVRLQTGYTTPKHRGPQALD